MRSYKFDESFVKGTTLMDRLRSGESLGVNQRLVSPNGRYTLLMQGDGNLVLYNDRIDPDAAYWSTDTWNLPVDECPITAAMQADVHFVLYDAGRAPRWASGTWGPGYVDPYLVLQDDGNLVIYHADTSPVWASGTPDRLRAIAGRGYLPAPDASTSSVIHMCLDQSSVTTSMLPPRQELVYQPVPIIREDGSVDATGTVQQPLVGVTNKMWSVGQTLRVKMFGGSAIVRTKVRQFAEQWLQYANIRFQWVSEDQPAEIRISFRAGAGSWSLIGRDALWMPFDFATMNFGWFDDNTSDAEFSRVVLHEFGHALGMVHEHQSPVSGINWDREKAYEYFKDTQGWDRAKVDAQVFYRYSATQTNFSQFDPISIMEYFVPPEITTDGIGAPGNNFLSDTDKEWMRRFYPFPPTPANRSGFLRPDNDTVTFLVEYNVVDPNVVQFNLDARPPITWWKAIEVPIDAGQYRMLEIQDGRSALAVIARSSLDQSRPIRFWKAKFLGVHTRLDYTWDVLSALPGGTRVSILWERD
jgi:Astacin (Peptidase family M12A)